MTRLLALDTVTMSCSAAVVTEAGPLAEITVSVPKTHSRRLMEMVDRVLALAETQPSDLDGIAVTRGPGSFTGLRIGISAVKGLAMAWNLPVAGLSALDVLARQAADSRITQTRITDTRIVAMIDARKKEVYHCRYRFTPEGPVPETGALVGPPESAVPEFTASPASDNSPLLFIGNGALVWKDRLRELCGENALFPEPEHHLIRAAVIGRMAVLAAASGQMTDAAVLLPQYIRKSDAELALGARVNNSG